MPRVLFTPAARIELTEAQAWYEQEVPGLGRRFRAAIDAAVVRIESNPLQFPAAYKKVRRCLLRGFPYALMFVHEGTETLTVIACFHGSRDPLRWRGRM